MRNMIAASVLVGGVSRSVPESKMLFHAGPKGFPVNQAVVSVLVVIFARQTRLTDLILFDSVLMCSLVPIQDYPRISKDLAYYTY